MHIERSRRAGSRTALGLKSGPLTFTLFFRNNLEGLDTRAALSSRAAQAAVAKTAGGMWPPLGFKAGRYTPGSLDRAVLEDCLGHPQEEVTVFFKGKGRGGRGSLPGLGAQGGGGSKRGAQARLSVAGNREPKQGKR